jgi:hypothetical protein
MCGLVGLIARKPMGFNQRELDLFEQVLMIDTLRGKDSTGVMSVFRDTSAQVIKTAQLPFLMYETKQWGELRGKTVGQGRFIAGHNRAATRGDVTNDNAHPFVENHIILMHNGTISNQEQLTKEKVDVDSHAICHAIASGDPKDVVQTIRGAFALIWYNTETEKIYAVRNDDRPLSLIVTDDYYGLVSEPWMMAMPMQRQGRKIINIAELEPFSMLSFDLNGNMEETSLPKPKIHHMASEYGEWWRQSQGGKYNRHPSQYMSPYEDDYGTWEDSLDALDPRKPPKTTSSPAVNEKSSSEKKAGADDVPFEVGEKEPPEIKNLRKALTDQARQKSIRESSQDCALLLPGGSVTPPKTYPETGKASTSTTDSAHNGNLIAAFDQEESRQRNIIADVPGFARGMQVLVKVWTINNLPNGRIKWQGKIVSPGMEMIDAQGFLPDNVLPNEYQIWLNTLCKGFVAWCTHTAGGPTIMVQDMERCRYTDIHGKDIPELLWGYAVHNCKCDGCQREIEMWEKNFTHVKLRHEHNVKGHSVPFNTLNVLCADCLMDKIVEGDLREKFTNRYFKTRNAIYTARSKARAEAVAEASDSDPAVQDREPISGEPVGKNGSIIVVPGSSTLQ